MGFGSHAPKQRRRWALVVVCGLALMAGWVGCRVLANRAGRQWNEPYYSRVAAIIPGMTDTSVLSQLGEPRYTYEAGSAPDHYYVKGYSYQKRPISNRVLIYFGGSDLIAYVYIDKEDRVEHVYIGRS